MRQRHVRHRLDLHYLEYPQIRLPLVEPKQWIMIGAEVLRQDWPANRAVEHPAECNTIDGSSLDAESNDAARVLIHDDQNPVGPQPRRFAPEQIDTPEAVLQVAQEGQPRRAANVRFGSVSGWRECAEPRPYRSGGRRPRRSAARFADSPNWDYAVSFR